MFKGSLKQTLCLVTLCFSSLWYSAWSTFAKQLLLDCSRLEECRQGALLLSQTRRFSLTFPQNQLPKVSFIQIHIHVISVFDSVRFNITLRYIEPNSKTPLNLRHLKLGHKYATGVRGVMHFPKEPISCQQSNTGQELERNFR